jgi:hypothetical protein
MAADYTHFIHDQHVRPAVCTDARSGHNDRLEFTALLKDRQ